MASGKTSTARSVLTQGNYSVFNIKIGGKEYPYTYDEKKNWIVTGRYDLNVCGGLDGRITDKNVMKVYLHRLMNIVKPDVMVFEAVLYGVSFKFGKEISDICRGDGYKYIGVILAPDFEDVMENLNRRNGGKPVNIENLSRMYWQSLTAADKLQKAGVEIYRENPRKYKIDDLHKIVEKYTA